MTDADDGGLRGHLPDQDTGDRKNRAGGDNGWKRKVQRFNHGITVGHRVLDLLIAAGNDDGIVDICAHLNGADHKVAHEEQRRICERRNGEVDPDTALNDQNQ